MKRFGVSEAQGRRRLGTQLMGGDLADQLQGRIGVGFAGAQYDQSNGDVIVAVTKDASTDKVDRALVNLGIDDVSRVITRTVTDQQLQT